MAAIISLIVKAVLDAIVQRLPGWIQEIQQRQAAAAAERKLAADNKKIIDFVNDAKPKP